MRHADVTILHGEFASENGSKGISERMTISTQSSSRPKSTRRAPGFVWLLAGATLCACSLLAPSDEHYLSDPSRANGEGGEGGEAGQAHSAAGDGAGGRGNGSGGRTNAAGEGGGAGSDAGSANGGEGGDAPLVCDTGFADCNGETSDGCEIDLRSSRENCGGCGKTYACAADEACESRKCISVSGCSDGTREGFLPVSTWPRIAGCTAWWEVGSLRDPKTPGSVCSYEGDECDVPADACGTGWHVCGSPPYGPTEISSQATAEQCAAQPGAYAAALGDQHCEPCTEEGDGAACCGDRCVQQNGNCIYTGMTAWFGVIDGYKNVCGAIESNAVQRGVMCCRAP